MSWCASSIRCTIDLAPVYLLGVERIVGWTHRIERGRLYFSLIELVSANFVTKSEEVSMEYDDERLTAVFAYVHNSPFYFFVYRVLQALISF